MGGVGTRAAARSIIVFGGFSSLAALPAHAGAWSQPDGVKQWSASISREVGDFGEAWRSDEYVEWGFGDGWGLNAKIESEIRIDTTYDDRSGFRLGLQKAFPIGERASFAIQASMLGGEALDGPECLGEGYEARAAIGTSFSLFGREGFVNAEAGQRSRGDACRRIVVEFASGIEFAPSMHLTLKAWSEEGDGARSAKFESGLAYDFGGLRLGVGWREEISGNFEEKGWLVTARSTF